MNVFVYSEHWHHFQLFETFPGMNTFVHWLIVLVQQGLFVCLFVFTVVEQNFWLVLRSLAYKFNHLILFGTRLTLQSK